LEWSHKKSSLEWSLDKKSSLEMAMIRKKSLDENLAAAYLVTIRKKSFDEDSEVAPEINQYVV